MRLVRLLLLTGLCEVRGLVQDQYCSQIDIGWSGPLTRVATTTPAPVLTPLARDDDASAAAGTAGLLTGTPTAIGTSARAAATPLLLLLATAVGTPCTTDVE